MSNPATLASVTLDAVLARTSDSSRRAALRDIAERAHPTRCESCGSDRIGDNGRSSSAADYAVACESCGHQWEPNQP